VALINLLDPEWFPYTPVNGSTFPGPDAILLADYLKSILTNQNVPPGRSPLMSGLPQLTW
jgi:hypothetical protein